MCNLCGHLEPVFYRAQYGVCIAAVSIIAMRVFSLPATKVGSIFSKGEKKSQDVFSKREVVEKNVPAKFRTTVLAPCVFFSPKKVGTHFVGEPFGPNFTECPIVTIGCPFFDLQPLPK